MMGLSCVISFSVSAQCMFVIIKKNMISCLCEYTSQSSTKDDCDVYVCLTERKVRWGEGEREWGDIGVYVKF